MVEGGCTTSIGLRRVGYFTFSRQRIVHSQTNLAGNGGLVDAINSIGKDLVKVLLALAMGETLGKSTGETGNHASLLGEDLVRLVTRVSSGKGDNGDALGVIDELLVMVDLGGKRELEHDLLVVAELVQLLQDAGLQQIFALFLVSRLDVDLRLDDRDKTMSNDLLANLELLFNDGLDTLRVGGVDVGSHLGSKDTLGLSACEELIQLRHGLHQLNSVGFLGKTLVALQEGNNVLLLPEEVASGHAFDLTVHGVLEQNGTQDLLANEARAGDDARTHGMDLVKHALFASNVGLEQRDSTMRTTK